MAASMGSTPIASFHSASAGRNDDLAALMSKLVTMASTIKLEDAILSRLSFSVMHDREHSIADANSRTFSWLTRCPPNPRSQDTGLDDQETQARESASTDRYPNVPRLSVEDQCEDQERSTTRDKFRKWLSSGNNIFHISGKPGAGKSTLMKFLSQDPSTKELLEEWAGKKKLVFAQFFFWSSGEKVQKSMEGLHRSILWELLRVFPSLGKEIFPHYSQHFAPTGRTDEKPFELSELESAFRYLTTSESIFKDHRICLFIDGLDEYEGDHWRLAHLLKDWAISPSLKVCVSSRPYNEFIHTFTEPDHNLHLHRLTRVDIRRYVEDELEADERFVRLVGKNSQYVRIVESLLDKAEGVFLWVRLVVRDLLSGLGNNYPVSQLEEELDQLPSDLQELYRKMFMSTRKSDRIRAARHYSLLTSRHTFWVLNRTLAVHAVLDDFYDSEYDITSIYRTGFDPPASKSFMDERTNIALDRINSRCKGIIQISHFPDRPDEPELWRARLDFMHRSAHDFLHTDEMQREISDLCGSFDAAKFLCMACLRLLKMTSMDEHINRSPDTATTGDVHQRSLNMYRARYGTYFWYLQRMTVPLVYIASSVETTNASPLELELQAASSIMKALCSFLPPAPPPNDGFLTSMSCGPSRVNLLIKSSSNDVELQEKTWLALSSFYTAKNLILGKLVSRQTSGDSSSHVLLHVSLGALHVKTTGVMMTQDDGVSETLVTSIMDCGISPNSSMSDLSDLQPFKPWSPSLLAQDWTVWKVFIQIIGRVVVPRQPAHRLALTDHAAKLVEIYLEHGADTDILLVGYFIPKVNTPASVPSAENHESNDSARPYFLTLEQVVDVWDPPNKIDLISLLRRGRKSSVWPSLWKLLWQPSSQSRISQIEPATLLSGIFLTTAVIQASDLDRVDILLTEKAHEEPRETDVLANQSWNYNTISAVCAWDLYI